ncbi:hypothetical protein T484DRAFT_1763063 [Baffinella frigidus]|nr:hypothetical protein T484DRAFT_1763063 [Cryptophyta sp. CCMP2293]
MIWALVPSAVDDGIAAQESSDEQQGSMAAAVAEATEQALRPAANFEYGRYKQWGGDAWGHKRWGWSVEPRDLARFDAANLKTPRPTMAAALASATAHAQMGAAELHGGYLAAFLETFTSTETSPALWAALEDSAAAANAGAGGRGNRAFALWQALAVAGDRVPPVAELALRAPLNAVAEWMVLWKYLRHDDLPDGWKAAKHGTKAHQYLQSAVDAGIAARGSLELVWTARQAWR